MKNKKYLSSLLLVFSLLLSGCGIVGAAVDVVSLPFEIVGGVASGIGDAFSDDDEEVIVKEVHIYHNDDEDKDDRNDDDNDDDYDD